MGDSSENEGTSFRASIKRKLKRSFRKERKPSSNSQNSGEEDSGAASQWYHHEPPPPSLSLIDPLDHMLLCQNEDEAEAEEDKNWPSPDIELSSEVQDILQASWKHLQERIETLGVVSFLSIFETHPDALNTFLPQVEIDSLEFHKMDKLYREKLRVHGLRVMSVVEKTMHRLGSNQRCLKMLKVFGRTHKRYQIPPSMLGYMGRSFMAAIEPTLTEDNAWNAEIKEAWASLFILITDGMQRGYDAADDTAAVVRFEEPPTVVAFLEETTAEEDEDESAFD